MNDDDNDNNASSSSDDDGIARKKRTLIPHAPFDRQLQPISLGPMSLPDAMLNHAPSAGPTLMMGGDVWGGNNKNGVINCMRCTYDVVPQRIGLKH